MPPGRPCSPPELLRTLGPRGRFGRFPRPAKAAPDLPRSQRPIDPAPFWRGSSSFARPRHVVAYRWHTHLSFDPSRPPVPTLEQDGDSWNRRGMRILHVVPTLRVGGAEQVVCDLALAQLQQGHEVLILTGNPSSEGWAGAPSKSELLVAGITRPGLHGYSSLPGWIWRKRKSLMATDIVHVHLTIGAVFGSLVEFLEELQRRSVPIVIETDHSAGMPISKMQARIYRVSRWRRRVMATVMADTHSTQPSRESRVVWIPNGIHPLRLRTSWAGHEPFTIGSLGLLRRDRQPDRYLELVDILSRRMPVRFLYGGDGPLRSSLERKIVDRNMQDRVEILGLVRDKQDFFSRIDTHVSLSISGGVGLVTLEAASTGTPCLNWQLTTGYAGQGSVIPSFSDPEALADSIVHCAQSESFRQSFGQCQSAWVREERSVSRMAERYEVLYRDALQTDLLSN